MLEKNGSRHRPGKEVSQKPNGKLRKWGLNGAKRFWNYKAENDLGDIKT